MFIASPRQLVLERRQRVARMTPQSGCIYECGIPPAMGPRAAISGFGFRVADFFLLRTSFLSSRPKRR